MPDEMDDLYAAQLFLVTERLRAGTRQELEPLWTLAGGNQARADELNLYVQSQDMAGVLLVGPETAQLRARLDAIDAQYQEFLRGTPPPPELVAEDAVAAELASYRAPRPTVRSLVMGDGDDGMLQRVVATPPSVLDESGELETPIELEPEQTWRMNGTEG